MNCILTIESKFARMILDGKKKYELRKRMLLDIPATVYLYDSTNRLIVGKCIISQIHIGRKESIWEIVKDNAGITKKWYDKYYKEEKEAVAWEISSYEKIEPVKIADLDIDSFYVYS